MSEVIYKSGQGYWTRMMSAAAFALLVVMGAAWIWDRWGNTAGKGSTAWYVAGGVALLFIAVMGIVMWWYLGHSHRSVDFLIATEGEMKKVNWSTRREIFGSTGVVIFVMFAITAFCFFCDRVFAFLFLTIDVLDKSALTPGS